MVRGVQADEPRHAGGDTDPTFSGAGTSFRWKAETSAVELSGGGEPTEVTSYLYDSLGRLEQVTLPGGLVRRYSFDLDSNRTGILENNVQVASYTYDPALTGGVDQLTAVTENGTTRTFSYDTDGNTTARGSDTLSWDGWGRHTGGSFAGGSLSYGFDPSGGRAGGQVLIPCVPTRLE